MAPTTYRKDDIAIQLLGTALRLYENNQDGFSVILLAGACENLLGELIKSGRDVPASSFPSGVPPSKQTQREQELAALKSIFEIHGIPRKEEDIVSFLDRPCKQISGHVADGDAKENSLYLALDLGFEVNRALRGAFENYGRYFGINAFTDTMLSVCVRLYSASGCGK